MPQFKTWRPKQVASVAIALAISFAATATSAAEIRIATWNVHEGMSVEHLASRSDDFRRAGLAIKPDVLLVQEVTSLKVVEAVRDRLGLKGYHCACSDFAPDDRPDFAFLEVGIISRYPLDEVIEFDATPDSGSKSEAPFEMPITPLVKRGIYRPVGDVRGFLWARIDQLKLTVAVLHLKSSRGANSGPDDFDNALKREFIAAAVATGVVEDRDIWPDYSCIVGGDINVGHSDLSKNGAKLHVDDDTPGPNRDGYDDTHALFRGGIISGLKMHNLVGHLTRPTFPSFPSTPIDNLYVTGPGEKRFSPATIMDETFGSDHCPVVSVYQTEVYPAKPKPPTIASPPKVATGGKMPAVVQAADARQFVDREGTVELTVKDSTLLGDRRACFLNSDTNRSRPDNFTVVFLSDGLQSLALAGIDDPAAHYRNRKIRVTGRIHLRQGGVQIVVSKAEQIRVVP